MQSVQPHPPPNLPLEGGGVDVARIHAIALIGAVGQYAATLARWMGVSNADLPLVLPNIGKFSQRDLGFMAAS